MEGYHEEGFGIIPFDDNFPYNSVDDLGFINFMDEAHFDQFIDLIRGDENFGNPVEPIVQSYAYEHHTPNFGGVDDALPPIEAFNFSLQSDQCLTREEITDGNSCAMNMTSTKKKSCDKVDRSKTLISERKRRGRMKDKLYALRSLVPNITKMDKASIVGDAVSFVQDLQMQAKNLKAEIASLEVTLSQGQTTPKYPNNYNKHNNLTSNFYPISKKIFKMDVFQVDEQVFYVRIISSKGNGVAELLYKGIEALTGIFVESSNLTSSAENYALKCTIHVMEREMEAINLQTLKQWIARVFINQGFEF